MIPEQQQEQFDGSYSTDMNDCQISLCTKSSVSESLVQDDEVNVRSSKSYVSFR